ncbi:MAG TPA: alpha-ketoacid dehydrogenase subunit beta [Steroidobacteraceae bacterium]|jgi:pyruvate dehydrogenase E1 component beta subunit|nr:alpha-ketoacid dehydrogenase subunit beta [Steroidobacteraceae bacterium]
MPLKSIRQAIAGAIRDEMRNDGRVFVIGEDVSGGAGCAREQQDVTGGVFGVTKGLLTEFGPERVIDTPISETAILGAALGAAMVGLRPIVDLMFADFIGVCFDQIFNQAAKTHYMSGGSARAPMVIRAAMGAGLSAGAQHSQTIYSLVASVPGLKCVLPSNAYDAYGLMTSAIRDDDPVVFFEHKALYGATCEVPDAPYAIPLGKAVLTREGRDVTMVTCGAMVAIANAAADMLAREGIGADVIDLRSISPLDTETILASVVRTGRVVVVDEAPPRCGLAADIAGLVAQHAFRSLKAPVMQITPPETPVPFAPALEKLYLPDAQRVYEAARENLRFA